MRIALNLDQLSSLTAFAKIITPSKAGETPILDAIQIVVDLDAETVTARGTDRYRAAEMVFPLAKQADFLPGDDDPEGGELVVPAGLLSRAMMMFKGAPLWVPVILADLASSSASIKHGWSDSEVSDLAVGGNFPPIERLIPDRSGLLPFESGAMLRMDLFGSFASMTLPGEKLAHAKISPWTVSRAPERVGADSRYAVVHLERADHHASIRVVIMPKRLLR